MNKMDHVVYSGWLTKSPPEQKLTGPWKFFRAKWKKRFFVLFKPASSLPGEYVLNYYRDEHCKKHKGSIDLEQCEQIIESLDSESFPYLLAIKTYHKGKERTYFLATQTEDQMSSWVRSLCSVCELKPDENPIDLPPAQQRELEKPTGIQHIQSPVTKVSPKPSQSHSQLQSQAQSQAQAQAQAQAQSPPVTKQPERENEDYNSYIPIDSCHTGKQSIKSKNVRRESVNSIPGEVAPLPPTKTGATSDNDDVFHPDIYEVPPRRYPAHSQDPYDIPPSSKLSPSTPRSSSDESHNSDSAYSSQPKLSYDIPRTHDTDDTYDVPPIRYPTDAFSNTPPARPPMPSNYTNIPAISPSHPNSGLHKVIPPQNVFTQDDVYDLPKSQKSIENGADLNAMPPVPTCGQTTHGYVNAAPGIIEGEQIYCLMDGAGGTTVDPEMYTAMHSDIGKHSLYQYPPPGRKPVPHCTISHLQNSSQDPTDTYIFSTARTRSFKRHSSTSSNTDKNHNRPSTHPRPLHHEVALPKRLENLHPDMSTSSEDEDGDVLVNTSPLGFWQSTPPAPRKQQEELKYIDLALDESSEKETGRFAHSHSSHGSQTDYREIDFVKTKALSEVKNEVKKSRMITDSH